MERELTHVSKNTVGSDNGSSHGNTNRNHLVLAASLVEVLCQSPGGGVGVVRLNCGTTPRGITVGVGKKLAIASDNGNHDSVVDEATEDCAVDLGEEHDTGRDLDCGDELAPNNQDRLGSTITYGIHPF